MIKKAY